MNISAAVKKWRAHPYIFAATVLGQALTWSGQMQMFDAIAKHKRVAIRSGHKVGKSNSMVKIALWWAITRPGAPVIMTSAGNRQVEKVLWREMRKIIAKAPVPLTKSRIALDPDTGIEFANGSVIFGFAPKDPETMAGFSGEDLLYLPDEASGIEDDIFEAMEGNLASGGRLLMCSNPTKTSGYFFRAFHSERRAWKCIHISSEDTPNASTEDRKLWVPGLATGQWVKERADLWGVQSPMYQVRVRGNFPAQGENAVISLHLVEQAMESDRQPSRKRLNLGVDVARFGDDCSVIQPARGRYAYDPTVIPGARGDEVAGRVLDLADRMAEGDEVPLVKVDSIGVGASVCDFLNREGRGRIELVEVNVAERATAQDEDGDPAYPNLRSQLWFALADWIDGARLPNDDDLAGELVAPVYTFNAKGQRVVESKDRMKKRLGNSPDRADALALAIYEPPEERGFFSFGV